MGYGERAPDTAVGQLIGALCALLGVFILALPVPIIVNRSLILIIIIIINVIVIVIIIVIVIVIIIVDSFAENYKNRVWKGHFMMVKQKGRDRDQERAAKASTR